MANREPVPADPGHLTVTVTADDEVAAAGPEFAASPASRHEPDVAVLVERLLAGEAAVMGELYDAFGVRCYALARRLLRDQELAEDAVQEAFLAFWRAPERFDPARGSLTTFLMTLTHRRAVDVLRREALQRRGRVATDDQLMEMASDEAAVPDQVQARLEGEAVRDALSGLPSAQREALQLAYYGGYTQREIASITGVPLGTVKTRMLAGTRALRGRLTPQLRPGPDAERGAGR